LQTPWLRAAILAFPTLLIAVACGNTGPPDPGFIRAPEFTNSSDDRRAWLFSHHATSDSYRLVVTNGVAAITRVGHEPWAMLSQSISAASVETLAGKRLALSIDLKGMLEDETWGEPLEPTGLIVRIQQPVPGSRTHALLGSRRSRTERLPLPAEATPAEWQRYTLEFDAPTDLEKLEVGVLMTTGGTVKFRRPSLRIVGEGRS